MNRSHLYTALGLCFLAAGFVAAVDRGVATAVWTNEGAVLTIGFAAVLLGFKLSIARFQRDRDLAAVDPVESTQPLPVPGEEFDDLLARSGEYGRHDVERTRARVEERIESLAIATLVRREGCTRATARERVREGTWTDDPHAAAFFHLGGDRAAELEAAVETRSLEPLRNRYRFQARRAAEEIVRLSEEAQR